MNQWRLPNEEAVTCVGNVLVDGVGQIVGQAHNQLVTGLQPGAMAASPIKLKLDWSFLLPTT